MNPSQIIARKRDGHALSAEEIAHFVQGYAAGHIPDYQMAALAMAIYLRGMDDAETALLTQEMLRSGATLAASDRTLRVDKHSTGGIGDKTSLIVAPLMACCGLKVPMLSGRGLGSTGGTLDKLESIPGFRANLSLSEIAAVVDRVGCVITGTTAELVPADRKLYALRDVTATVPSIPLIAASIMSKKLAETLAALVLDVKVGSGAFMKNRSDARRLAQTMVRVGVGMGVRNSALLTDMSQPLGRLAGNSVEVDESLAVLSGAGPQDLRELSLALAAEALVLQGSATDSLRARELLVGHLDSGRALAKFAEMIAAQGGDLSAPRPRAPAGPVLANRDGYVVSIDVERLGLAIIEMGGGRKQLDDVVDHSVGLEMLVRLGDRVRPGQPQLNVFAQPNVRQRVQASLEQAIEIGPEPVSVPPLIIERIEA
ncbi:MAG TPA: thymidine phosphorylase [Pirellulales bacterium]|nr:thymidine phosphorylase [Pirellulales bacterium]